MGSNVGGLFQKYPKGPTESIPTGFVSLSTDNKLSFSLSGLESKVSSGIHIHEGTSCEINTGTHHWEKEKKDGWKTIKYKSDENGNAQGTINVNFVTGAFDFSKNLDHTCYTQQCWYSCSMC